jgi:hypothetical protein
MIFGVTDVHNCLAVVHLGATEFYNSVTSSTAISSAPLPP